MNEQENGLMKSSDMEQVRTLDQVFTGEGDVMAAFMNELAVIKPADFKKKLTSLKTSVELTSGYLEMEDGETKRFLLFDITTFHTVDQTSGNKVELPAVKLIGEDKKTVITAATIIVNSLTAIQKLTPIEISRLGKPAGKRYVDYNVTILST